MIRGFYSSASGLLSQQQNMNVISNNISNISTTAFKPQQSNFSALLYENLNGGAGNDIQMGHGTKVTSTAINFAQGGLNKTDMPMDCAIMGEGFFATSGKDAGSITYTRDGNFGVSVEGSTSYLVNGSGRYVLDEKGSKIEIKEKTVSEKKDAAGNVIERTEAGGFEPSKVGVYTFPNQYGLSAKGGNQYMETETSGKAVSVKQPDVKVGYLEGSGVEISQEMVKMMEASKGFSINAKLIQAADEMEKTINQLR